ncbi:MAG: hypothetical protein ACOY0T_37510 [Myxococcota bacterium]
MSDWDSYEGEITRLGRALRAQLSLLTGQRATGRARVRSTGAMMALPPNTYAVPIIDGQAHEELLAKVAFNPRTELPHQQGGAWLIDPTAEPAGTDITFVANNGGALFNFQPGTKLRFSPGAPGLEPIASVIGSGFSGGVEGPVKQVVVFDDIGGPAEEMALFQARVSGIPAIVLAWMQSAPVEGRTAGVAQGATRKSRSVRIYFETWALYVVTANASSGEARRSEGLRIIEAARTALSDRRRNDDGELLSSMGTGIEILTSARVSPRRESAATFMVTLRLARAEQARDPRSFQAWTRTNITSFAEAQPPQNADELVLHSPSDAMPEE